MSSTGYARQRFERKFDQRCGVCPAARWGKRLRRRAAPNVWKGKIMSAAVVAPSPTAPIAPTAWGLLAQAKRGLTAAEWEAASVERFTSAYSSALRAAAAVLAASGRPHRGRARPTSVWLLLPSVAPELGEWAAFFAAHSARHAAAQAGIGGRITARAADDLLRQSWQFLELAERAVRASRARRAA